MPMKCYNMKFMSLACECSEENDTTVINWPCAHANNGINATQGTYIYFHWQSVVSGLVVIAHCWARSSGWWMLRPV
jgi:hypothetical protein